MVQFDSSMWVRIPSNVGVQFIGPTKGLDESSPYKIARQQRPTVVLTAKHENNPLPGDRVTCYVLAFPERVSLKTLDSPGPLF